MRKGRCKRCGNLAWVNTITLGGDFVGEFCGDCFDLVNHDEPGRNPTSRSSGNSHNDPGFDNVIRALEEDR